MSLVYFRRHDAELAGIDTDLQQPNAHNPPAHPNGTDQPGVPERPQPAAGRVSREPEGPRVVQVKLESAGAGRIGVDPALVQVEPEPERQRDPDGGVDQRAGRVPPSGR